MFVVFYDLQHERNPQNGVHFADATELNQLVDTLWSKRTPFACQLKHEQGSELIVGFSNLWGFVQFTGSDSMPPYLMATMSKVRFVQADMEFDIGGTRTPIAGRYLLTIDQIRRVVQDFVVSGRPSVAVNWEEFE